MGGHVGVRELAKALDMKGGNITYYFPTKDDIVLEVSRLLGEENNRILVKKELLSISGFLDILSAVFKNHYKFRGLFLSLPNLLKQNKAIKELYNKRQAFRRETIFAQLDSMAAGGYIKIPPKKEFDSIFNVIVMTSRFWLSNASVEDEYHDMRITMRKYLDLIAGQLLLIATAKGRRDVEQYFA